MALLVAGSYDKYILGWSLTKTRSKQEQEPDPNPEAGPEKKPKQKSSSFSSPWLKTKFSYQAHMGPVKCAAMAGPVLATGGDDDTIRIFDVASACDMGTLQKHRGAITTLKFFVEPNPNPNPNSNPVSVFPKNLLSGSVDGTVTIWDAGTWVDLKVMKAHKKGVNDLCIHPSGKLAVSVGRDCRLSMFNLVKGRCTFSSNLHKEATVIEFNLGAESYSMVVERDVFVHRAEDFRVMHSLQHGNRVLCLTQDDQMGLILTGGEESIIRAWDLQSGKIAYSLENAHKSRIKGLVALGSKTGSESAGNPYLVASASSDGVVRVWDTRMIKKGIPEPVTEVDSKTRLTCLVGSLSKSLKQSASLSTKESGEQQNQSSGKPDVTTGQIPSDINVDMQLSKTMKSKKKKKKKSKKVLGVVGTTSMKAKGHEKLTEKRK